MANNGIGSTSSMQADAIKVADMGRSWLSSHRQCRFVLPLVS